MNPFELTGAVLMLVGTLISLLAAWGILDFPSALARMHAATKSASLGLTLIAIGAGIAARSWGLVGIGILLGVFLFLTAPISGHMVGRATYLAGRASGFVHDDLADVTPAPLEVPTYARAGFAWARLLAAAAVWMLLWRDISLGTLLGGLLVGLVLESIRRVPALAPSIRLGGTIRFLMHYIWMVIMSNVRVAWEVITPGNERIREAIVGVQLDDREPAVSLLVANAISFTPGALTIELTAAPTTVFVHVLHFESVEQVEQDVRRLEALAAGVFRPTAAAPVA